MTFTDRAQQFVGSVREKALEIGGNLADKDRQSALVENGRTVISQGAAFVTDTAASARDAARKHGPVVAQQARGLADKGIAAARNSSQKMDAELTKLDLVENTMRQRKLIISIAASVLQIAVSVRTLRKLRKAAKS